jgi:glucosamine-6-phosphate deaminase
VICRSFPSEIALARAAARLVIDTIRRLPTAVIGLPTGRTPLLAYEEIARLTRAESIDWSGVRTFNLDEFVGLGPGDRTSYRAFMDERLFRPVGLTAAQVGFLDGTATDLDAECDRYERAIVAAGGIDLLLLGIGANGHIGFNEPGDALSARTHRVALDAPTRAANAWWFGDEIARVPGEALTMGMATILQSRAIVLMATGAAKAEAVRAMLHGPITTRVPASFLQLHPHVLVMLDDEAAAGAACDRAG